MDKYLQQLQLYTFIQE
ncbi:hypothetical protein Goari_002964 [Gossypium aridum]|nr:hypothetical protein [Gossypium aridum]